MLPSVQTTWAAGSMKKGYQDLLSKGTSMGQGLNRFYNNLNISRSKTLISLKIRKQLTAGKNTYTRLT